MTTEHVTPAGANIFADLGFVPEEAENLRVRAELLNVLIEIVEERGMKQREAAALFGVSQPRISDLMRGGISCFTIDSLVNMLSHAGLRVETRVTQPPATPEGAEASPPRALRASA